jgi:hypothetical protein
MAVAPDVTGGRLECESDFDCFFIMPEFMFDVLPLDNERAKACEASVGLLDESIIQLTLGAVHLFISFIIYYKLLRNLVKYKYISSSNEQAVCRLVYSLY